MTDSRLGNLSKKTGKRRGLQHRAAAENRTASQLITTNPNEAPQTSGTCHAEFEDTSNHRSTMAADAQENDSYSYEDRKNDNE